MILKSVTKLLNTTLIITSTFSSNITYKQSYFHRKQHHPIGNTAPGKEKSHKNCCCKAKWRTWNLLTQLLSHIEFYFLWHGIHAILLEIAMATSDLVWNAWIMRHDHEKVENAMEITSSLWPTKRAVVSPVPKTKLLPIKWENHVLHEVWVPSEATGDCAKGFSFFGEFR